MIGAIVGAGAGAIGGILGGLSKKKMMEEQQAMVKQQMSDNQAWYDRRYNEDATQRADAQRMLTMTEEAIKNRNRAAAGTAAVMGGTEESVAAARAANAEAYSDTASQIAAAGADRKDKIEDQYIQRKDAFNDTLRELKANTPSGLDILSQTIGGAASGAMKGMGMG